MNETDTKRAISEQGYCRSFKEVEALTQIAINLAKIVDRLDAIERAIWINSND